MLTVNETLRMRDAEMRNAKELTNIVHPKKPEWLQSDEKVNPTPTSATPKPILIKFDKFGKALNEQQVLEPEQVQAMVDLPMSVCGGDTDADLSWRHLVVTGLLSLSKHFTEVGPVDETTVQIKFGLKTIVSSKREWTTGALILVPTVHAISSIQMKSRQDVNRNRMLVELVHACDEDKAFVLLPAIKLPRKNTDPTKNPDKLQIYPGWLARRSTIFGECNMELKQLPLDSIFNCGDGHEGGCWMDSYPFVLPVWSNTKLIAEGSEIVIYTPPSVAVCNQKVAVKKTWKTEVAGKQKSSK